MNIVLANLSPQENIINGDTKISRLKTLHFPMGPGIIASVLQRTGRRFITYDSYVDGTTEGFLANINQEKPDVILLSFFLGNYSYRFLKEIANTIKNINDSIIIIVGGPMANTIPELLISKTLIDFVVKGEGELTIINLLNAIEDKNGFNQVKGIYFRDNFNNVVFTGEQTRIDNLDDYPFPFYDAFPIKPYVEYLKKTDRCWELSTSRGCYASCNFCKLTFGEKITSYSYRVVVDHMVYVSGKYGINHFSFVNDNFLNNPKGINDFVTILQEQPHEFKWRFQGRADRITPELVEKAVAVGLFDISFGIESGSQEMIDRYGKGLDIEKVFHNLSLIKNMVGIHATFIVGGPGEDWDTIKKTKQFIEKLKLRNAGIGILTLFPGTTFYKAALEDGLIDDEEEYCMTLGPVYDRPYTNVSDLSDSDLLKARDILEETAREFGPYT